MRPNDDVGRSRNVSRESHRDHPTSSTSFDEAVTQSIAKASETITGIAGAWVQDPSVEVVNGKVTAYKVTLKLTFVLKDN